MTSRAALGTVASAATALLAVTFFFVTAVKVGKSDVSTVFVFGSASTSGCQSAFEPKLNRSSNSSYNNNSLFLSFFPFLSSFSPFFPSVFSSFVFFDEPRGGFPAVPLRLLPGRSRVSKERACDGDAPLGEKVKTFPN